MSWRMLAGTTITIIITITTIIITITLTATVMFRKGISPSAACWPSEHPADWYHALRRWYYC